MVYHISIIMSNIIIIINKYVGVFRQGIDDVQVSSVSVHPHGHLIAASYANGDVRVFRYPCISQQVDDRYYD